MSFKLFYERYISLNLKDYSNLGVDFEINKFLIVVLIGIIAAIIMISYKRSVLNLTVSKLLRHEALSEESAKTLSELGINLARVRRELSEGAQLKSLVTRVGEVKLTYEEYMSLKAKKAEAKTAENKQDNIVTKENDEPAESKASPVAPIDFDVARFYVKKENVPKATDLTSKSSSLILNTVLYCVLTVAVFVCLVFLMPEILNLINGFFAP